MTVPLAVALSTPDADRHITSEVRDLTFRSVAPGGFASCTVALDRPLTLQAPELEQFARVIITDTRSGAVVWEGRLEDPGRGAGSDGQVWDLTAMGPSAHTRDRTVPLVYVDRDLSRWVRADNFTPGAVFAVESDPGDTSATSEERLVFRFPAGLPIVVNSRVVARYWGIAEAGMTVGRYDYTWDAGVTNAALEVQAVTRIDGGATGEAARAQALNVAGSGADGKDAVTDFPATRTTVEVRLMTVSGGGTVAVDTNWVSVNPYVMAARLNADGTDATAATSHQLYAHEIVNDLLGRLLPDFDGTWTGAVTSSSYGITQLAYPDGTTPAQVLDDLMVFEPGFFWAAWEQTATGAHRFEWSQWPTVVRYEADTSDGYTAPSSSVELFNAVTVRWRDAKGRSKRTRRTQVVAALDDLGMVREGYVDLGDEVGSVDNAVQAGDMFLQEHAFPANAGQLTVARPILDLVSGRMVDPWEIRPGSLVRVRGVLPRVDALNPTRDGVTVMRVVSVDYQQSSNTATLQLDSYSRAQSAALAPKPGKRRR